MLSLQNFLTDAAYFSILLKFQTQQGVGVGYGQKQERGKTEHYFSSILQTVGHHSIFILKKIQSFEPNDVYPLSPTTFLVILPPDFGILLCILILAIILNNFSINRTILSLPQLKCVKALHPCQCNKESSHHPKLLLHGTQFQYHILWTKPPRLPIFSFSNSHYLYSHHTETYNSPFLACDIITITQKIHKL